MELCRWMAPLRITSGLLVLFLPTPAAYPQASPAAPQTALASPPAVDLGELRQEIRELSLDLRQLQAEVKEARGEATELRRALKNTSDELLGIKGQLAASRDKEKTPADGAPSSDSPQAGEANEVHQRLAKVEEEQQLLGAKVDDQYQTKVESGSKYRVRLSGMALLNTFATRGATDNFDVPGFAVRRDPAQPNGAFGATLRQSIVGFDVFGPDIAGARTRADLRVDFFGGFTETPEGVTSGLVRLRTGGLRLDWPNTSVVLGQYAPFFSPLSPTSLASVAYPAMSASGNLWVWTPEAYLEHRLTVSEGSSVSLEGGVMDPLTGELPGDSNYRTAQAGERSGQPAYAARVAWVSRTKDGPLSVGLGGYYARQNWGFGRIVNAWAGTADWDLPLGHWFALTGEFYRGQALGGLGAGEGRSVASTGALGNPQTEIYAPDSTGGWAQLKFTPIARLEFNNAFGEDFSPTAGLRYSPQGQAYAALLGRNQTVLFNGIYHLRSNLMFSVEYRRLRTSLTQPRLYSANQVSLSAATLF